MTDEYDDGDLEQGDWDNQRNWGPRYADWWEVCDRCGGFYNWFNIEVMEGVTMAGWVHLAGYCDGRKRDRGDRFVWGGAHGGKNPKLDG